MAHIHELIDFTVTAYAVHEKHVLLILHKKLNLWLPPGGHIELDEDPDQAVLREIKEECGINVVIHGNKLDVLSDRTKPLHTPAFMDIHKISETHKHIGMHYVCTPKDGIENESMNQDELSDMKWFSREDIEKAEDILPEVKEYARRALQMIKE